MGWERILAGMGASVAEAGQLQATRREKMRDDMAMEQWRRGLEEESKRMKGDATAVLIQYARGGGKLLGSNLPSHVQEAIDASGVSDESLLAIQDDAAKRAEEIESRKYQKEKRERNENERENKEIVAEVVEVALERGRTEYGLINESKVDIESIVDEVAPMTRPDLRKQILLEAKKQFRITTDHETRALGARTQTKQALKVAGALGGDDDSSTDATTAAPDTTLPDDVNQQLIEGVDTVAKAIMKEEDLSIDGWFGVLISSGDPKQIKLRQKLTEPVVGLWKKRMLKAGLEPRWTTTAQKAFLEDVKREMLIRTGGDTRLRDLLSSTGVTGILATRRDKRVYNRLSGHLRDSIRAALDKIAAPAAKSEQEGTSNKPTPEQIEEIENWRAG